MIEIQQLCCEISWHTFQFKHSCCVTWCYLMEEDENSLRFGRCWGSPILVSSLQISYLQPSNLQESELFLIGNRLKMRTFFSKLEKVRNKKLTFSNVICFLKKYTDCHGWAHIPEKTDCVVLYSGQYPHHFWAGLVAHMFRVDLHKYTESMQNMWHLDFSVRPGCLYSNQKRRDGHFYMNLCWKSTVVLK